MATAYRTYNKKRTSQREPIPGREKDMAQNNAGGFSFVMDDWKRLDRFLVLGTPTNTYYVSAKEMTRQNAVAVEKLIDQDGIRVVGRIVEISEAGRAPSNDPALFALALASIASDRATRQSAYRALPRCARIGTHLFHFIQYREQVGKWSRGLRTAVGNWYQGKSDSDLAYQLVKYQQRDGWSHRDLLRLAHPKPENDTRKRIYRWAVKGWDDEYEVDGLIQAFEQAKTADVKTLVKLIRDYNLPREAIPTEKLTEIAVWEALLEKMPYEAMTRNLATMTRVGLLKPMSDAAKTVAERLGNQERILKAKLHPIKLLAALKTYEQGHGERGQNTWNPVPKIVDALNEAFYLAFGNVTPTGKRMLLGIDVSGSMTSGSVAGVAGLTPNVASAALALVTARTESDYHIMGFATNFVELGITPQMRLGDVVRKINALSMGGTDCALPMLWATKNKVKVDLFGVYTDSETWFGVTHPTQALQQYRDKFNPKAKEVVVGMTATNFSIADPNDAGQIDVVGFDTATPQLISDFACEGY